MGQCYSWSSGCIVSQRLFNISADQCDSGWDVRSIWALAGGRFHERVTSLKCVLPQAWFILPCHSHISPFKEQKSPKQSEICFYGKTIWLTLTHHWTSELTSLRNLKLFSKISVNRGRLSHPGFDGVQFQTCSSEVSRHIVIFNLSPAYIIKLFLILIHPEWTLYGLLWFEVKYGCQTISHWSELADNHFHWFSMWSLDSPITLLGCRRCKNIVLWVGDNILKTCWLI